MKKHKKQKPKAKQRRTDGLSQPVLALERRAVPLIAPRKQSKSTRHTGHVVAAVAPAYSQDDRQALTLLMLPFLIVAFAISTSQSMRFSPPFAARTAEPAIHHLPSPAPLVQSAPAVPQTAPAVAVAPPETVAPATDAPMAAATTQQPAVPAKEAQLAEQAANSPPDPIALQPVPPAGVSAATSSSASELAKVPAIDAVPAQPAEREVVALLVPDPVAPVPLPSVTAPAAPASSAEKMCVREAPVKRTPAFFLGDKAGLPNIDSESFGRGLAAAAREQLDDFTVYTDKYQTLRYPMGDLPAFYGVCTDVIVRAYRELGLDLQQLVHQAKVGSGDTNIDHRRVGTLQKFFAKYGDSLPITEFGEDYMPGDIVSYYRPQNAHSRTHIAIVSDVVGPSGQLMIIHNRGWGPQIEDALFVDQITGHYRYSGSKQPISAPVANAAGVSRAPAVATNPSKAKAQSVRERAALTPAKTGSIQR